MLFLPLPSQEELRAEKKKHEDQLHHNTVVMMEMQDSFQALQRELFTLNQKKIEQYQTSPTV